MNRSVASKCLLILAGAAASACGLLGLGGGKNDEQGELVGVPGREGWVITVPYGMVPIPAGTFHMGQADEDPASTQINYNKQVTIGSFFMDDTEITNNEYRQFTNFYLVEQGNIEGFETIDAETFRQKYYPDTTSWVKDFAHHMGDPIQDYYYWHPGYDDYPVVGINWDAATYFANWRTAYLNDYRKSVGDFPMPNFRFLLKQNGNTQPAVAVTLQNIPGVTHTSVMRKVVCWQTLSPAVVTSTMMDLRIRLM
jgi:sulfatase modifying factor 1